MSLFSSTGDSILKLVYDDNGNLVPNCAKKQSLKNTKISGLC